MSQVCVHCTCLPFILFSGGGSTKMFSLPSRCMAQDSNVTYVWEVATKTETLSNFRALQDLKILIQSLTSAGKYNLTEWQRLISFVTDFFCSITISTLYILQRLDLSSDQLFPIGEFHLQSGQILSPCLLRIC